MTSPIRILHLEDEEAHVMLAETTLRVSGIDCEVVPVDTRAGFKAALEQGDLDLILCDHRLSEFDAIEALKIARDKCSEVPFIVVAGVSDDDFIIQALTGGATDYVPKAHIARLVPAVTRALAEADERRQRRQADEALWESREKYRSIFENAVEGIFQSSPEGRFLSVNPAMARMLGFDSPEEMVGTSTDLGTQLYVDSADRVEFRRLMEAHSEVRDFQFRAYRKDRRAIWVSEHARAVRDESGSVVYYEGTTEDITERKKAEGQLLLQTLALKAAVNGFMITDREGTIIWVNPAFTAMTGYSAEEAVGQNPRFLKSGEHDQTFYQGLWGKILAGEVWRGEMVNRRKDGSLYTEENVITPFHSNGSGITHFISAKQDVTERKQMEENLGRMVERFDVAVCAAGLGVWDWEVQKNKLVWDDRMFELYGSQREDFSGVYEAWVKGVHPDDSVRGDEEVQQALRDEKELDTEFRVVWTDGTVRYLKAYAQVVRDSDGKALRMTGINYDITDLKQTEESLRDSNQQLKAAMADLRRTQQEIIQQERLRALGQMASGIAHDFNNALAPVVGFSDLMLMNPEILEDRETTLKNLKLIAAGAKDAANVVSRLKEFYRKRAEGETFLPLDLNSVVKEAVSLTQPKWKDQGLAAGISIQIKTDLQKLPVISGNASELREALTNLIFNAVDAMPEGGVITLRTYVSVGAPEYGRSDHSPTHVILEISDTGVGMDEETRRCCLDPLFTTKGEGGTGMGLSMVFGIVHRHEGTIDIESKEGHGTTFILHFPTVDAREPEANPTPSEKPARSLHILVVDDEPVVREVTSACLLQDGHTVETATNGREGLQKFHRGWYDLVITDRAMPEMGGDQLAAAIKHAAPDKPVLMVTGFGDVMQATDDLPAGVDHVVSKPITLGKLRQAVTSIHLPPPRALTRPFGNGRIPHQTG